MLFLVLGVLFLGMRLAEVGPFVDWPWWVIGAPFLLAVAWWFYADKSGRNVRRAVRGMEERKSERRRAALNRLGLGGRGLDKEERERQKIVEARQRQIDKIEGKRAASRKKNRDSVLGSRFDGESDSTRFDETKR